MTLKKPKELLREALDVKGWSQTDLAYALDTPAASINQILNGKRSISNTMAKALAVALGLDASEIVKLQAEYELKNSDEPELIVETRSRILTQYPLRDMIKRGWIDPEHGNGTLEEQICNFFNVATLDEVPHLTHSAKKTDYEHIPSEQLTWLFRVKQIAQEMVVDTYSVSALKNAVDKLITLRSDPDGARHVPNILSEAGVRFVIVEGLPKGMIDGVCFWLDDNSPVIGLSLRYDRIDNFWFVLRHEIAHILHGHGKDAAIIDVDLDGQTNVNEEERIANEEAANFCVPAKKMNSFYLRKNPFFSDREVIAFSKRVGVHPGLVVGQLHRRTGKYNFLRRHLINVRDVVSGSMMVDGWGDIVPTGN